MNNNCIVLSAGFGSRMKSQKPKVLFELIYKPMINWVVDSCMRSGIQKQNISLVVGYRKEEIMSHMGEGFHYTHQKELLGTAHAVQMCVPFLEKNTDSHTLVLCGDAPLMDARTIKKALEEHKKQNNSATVITADLDNPFGYGRIIKRNGKLQQIIEQKDGSTEELAITEINSGAYWFNTADLLSVIDKIENNNAQKEFYLTDAISILLKNNHNCGTYKTNNSDVVLGANTRTDLYNLNKKVQEKILLNHIENGVEILDMTSTFISPDTVIEPDVSILPGSIIKGKSYIDSGSVIGPYTVIDSCDIGKETIINSSQVYSSKIGNEVKIGPYCHIRPNCEIDSFVKIGDFVEIKNSKIGKKTSVSHLTYIGDSIVGEHVNFGCGVVTVNYDGENKYTTTIGNDCFIGCNTNLVAPVTIGDNGYTGAGSTITKDVPSGGLALERGEQKIIENWAFKKLETFKKK